MRVSQMKEAYYFPHDANARHDPSVLAMRSVYGMEGYGRFWVLIEMLREQTDYKLQITKYTWDALAMQMQCTAEEAQKFVSDCINEFNLLRSDGEFIWSESLIRRMEGRSSKSEKARKAAYARWSKRKGEAQENQGFEHHAEGNANADANADADAMQRHCDSNAIKEKKIKEKEKKGEESILHMHAHHAHASTSYSSQTKISDYERDIMAELWKVDNYPADETKDLELIRALTEEYPTVELLAEARKWRTYKLDNPLVPGKSNPRSQFRTWIRKAAEWQQNKDARVALDEPAYIPPYWKKYNPDEEDDA